MGQRHTPSTFYNILLFLSLHLRKEYHQVLSTPSPATKSWMTSCSVYGNDRFG